MISLRLPPSYLPLFAILAWGGLTVIHFLTTGTRSLPHLVPQSAQAGSVQPDRHFLSQGGAEKRQEQDRSEMDRHEVKENDNKGDNREHNEGREKGPEQEQEREHHNWRKEKGHELTHEEQEEQDTWDKEQEDRKKTVDKTCAEWKYLGVATRQGKESRRAFLYSTKHKLLYCRNAKVGTSTWLAHFLSLSSLSAGEKAKLTTSRLLHKVVPQLFKVRPSDGSIRTLAKSSVSFSMVRHPFKRLVSAYQDKIIDSSDTSYQHVAFRLQAEYGEISFPAFASFILEASGDPRRLDVHWRPYYARCDYCNVPYMVIAKAESFSTDLFHIGRLAGVSFQSPDFQTHISSGNTSQLTNQYFQQMDVIHVQQLYRLYQPDFEMFNYSADEYLAMAKQDPNGLDSGSGSETDEGSGEEGSTSGDGGNDNDKVGTPRKQQASNSVRKRNSGR